MSLREYRRKRDFTKTAEPTGKKKRSSGRRFVVQKHDASRLHFDLRLELNGVLLSWAVPKGPCLDSKEKRLAVQVEDHPLDYQSFEGTIPAGEYGAGTVMVWDEGVWDCDMDPEAGLRSGQLKFTLLGQRLQGRWVLVRLKSGPQGDRPNWLLIKERDEHVVPMPEGDIVASALTSIKSGRTMEQIAAGKKPRRVAQSADKPKATTRGKGVHGHVTSPDNVVRTTKRLSQQKASKRITARSLPGARKATMPNHPKSQLATLVRTPPDGDQWLHEIKFDGYRMFCGLDRGAIRFVSRNGQDWTERLRSLVSGFPDMPCQQALLDGEVVVLDDRGSSNFQMLQNSLKGQAKLKSPLVYCTFDCLSWDGYDLTRVPLLERKEFLKSVLSQQTSRSAVLQYSEHHRGDGARFYQEACRAHLEGIVSKRADAPYVGGRTMTWVKSKCRKGQELIICGFTNPAGSRIGFGALLMGYYDRNKKLCYAGRVGTGFDNALLSTLTRRLRAIEIQKSPFSDLAGSSKMPDVHWVRPGLVADVEFSNWTDEGLIRQAAFRGLREDKPAHKVTLELPVATPEPAKSERGATTMHTQRRLSSHARTSSDGEIQITHSERVVYSDAGITKGDVANYYDRIADWILPHLVDRPLSLLRCPDGVSGKCFFQKHPPTGLPESVTRFEVREKDETDTYLAVRDRHGLLALIQFGVIEIHPWGSRRDDIERPDRLIFDLDPAPDIPWREVIQAAIVVRSLFEQLGLESFVKTSGNKGLHVAIPIQRRYSWHEAKAFCKSVAELIERTAPNRFTTNMSKKVRTGKVYIDYLRNDRGATSVVAYSLRAKAGAAISMPVTWDELSRVKSATAFRLENLASRLKRLTSDPWEPMLSVKQSLNRAMMQRVASAPSLK